jgi:hypothetical protein
MGQLVKELPLLFEIFYDGHINTAEYYGILCYSFVIRQGRVDRLLFLAYDYSDMVV